MLAPTKIKRNELHSKCGTQLIEAGKEIPLFKIRDSVRSYIPNAGQVFLCACAIPTFAQILGPTFHSEFTCGSFLKDVISNPSENPTFIGEEQCWPLP